MAPASLSAEALLERFFLPLYPPDARDDLAAARATDANPGGNPRLLAELDDAAARFTRMAPRVFDGRDLGLDRTDASVHRLGAALTRERRDAWASERDPEGVPVLAHVVLHGALYVGACAVASHGAAWRMRRPMWESLVHLRSRAGDADLAPFSWWLRALSDAEIDRATLAERYRRLVEVPCVDPSAWPVLAPPARKLPRLVTVRYDLLHRHLKAHLPELRDLGPDFPSAERFAELSLAWLDFVWLGEGRTLLVHGRGAAGAHLFWLDAAGFAKAAFFPVDAGRDHEVAIDGEKLTVRVPFEGRVAVHEMLWWGM